MSVLTPDKVILSPALFGGPYQTVAGTVDELGIPGRYRVMLFHRRTGRLVAVQWSGEDGAYQFTFLKNDAFFAVAFDHGEAPLNAGIADFLPLERMP